MLEVVKGGALTTVQDLGRAGWAHLGVPRSGALDAPALALANALVGNAADAAGLETTLTGCTLRFRHEALVAVTGATAVVTVGGEVTTNPFRVRPADTLTIGPARAGVRSYIAVRGGIDVEPVLGSRSYDTLSGIGPPPLRAGDTLPIGAPGSGAALVDGQRTPADDRVPIAGSAASGGEIVLRVRFGPRDDWFVEEARQVLCGSAYTVTVSSNRVGARLAGAPLRRANLAELPSEGLVLGAVQVAPDGNPIVFLADHPTTGGYPVIAVVDAADLALLAQARPGTEVRFRGSER